MAHIYPVLRIQYHLYTLLVTIPLCKHHYYLSNRHVLLWKNLFFLFLFFCTCRLVQYYMRPLFEKNVLLTFSIFQLLGLTGCNPIVSWGRSVHCVGSWWALSVERCYSLFGILCYIFANFVSIIYSVLFF